MRLLVYLIVKQFVTNVLLFYLLIFIYSLISSVAKRFRAHLFIKTFKGKILSKVYLFIGQ